MTVKCGLRRSLLIVVLCGSALLSFQKSVNLSQDIFKVFVEEDDTAAVVATSVVKSNQTSLEPTYRHIDIKRSLSNDTDIDTRERERDVNRTASENSSRSPVFAGCLLIKDDNDILNEWIAYHYHTLNLRHLVVAVDPSSSTSPASILEKWKKTPFRMSIQQWTDSDYLPDFFLHGNFSNVPSFVKKTGFESEWHQESNVTLVEIEADIQHINNHRFRQATFLSHCFRYHKTQKHQGQVLNGAKWVIHIDTDEFVTVNPIFREKHRSLGDILIPSVPSAGSLSRFFQDVYRMWAKKANVLQGCLMIPRIMFGSTEDDKLSHMISGWSSSRFETIRWSHRSMLNETNGYPKAIIDVSTIPDDHPVFLDGRVKSIHRPLESSYKSGHEQVCEKLTKVHDLNRIRKYPLVIYHYIGSWARFSSRDDVRRTRLIYNQKAAEKDAIDDGWIKQWFKSFIDEHGEETIERIMGDYRSLLTKPENASFYDNIHE